MSETTKSPKVTKAVIAAAGFGTRFLPWTKAMPKEMLPLIDKPIIQYIVEDLVAAGIKDIIIVGSSSKRSIEDHFDVPNADLLENLRGGGVKKEHYIEEIERISELANFVYIRQKGPYGTATPIMNAAHLLGNEPFIFSFADDITVGQPNAFQQMITHYETYGAGILPCIRVRQDDSFSKYGIVAGDHVTDDVIKMTGVVEKPGKDKAPSDFAAVGGYLLTPEVFNYIDSGLAKLKPDNEFYVTDCLIDPMLKDGHNFYACEIKGKRYDTGDKLEYLKTVVDFALAHDELGDSFEKFLRERIAQ